MRSYNDIKLIEETLRALEKQTFTDFELWNHDSSSSDGTLEVLLLHNDPSRVFVNDPTDYVPGVILNHAVRLCRGEIIVFLNSDATPANADWLETLISNFDRDKNLGAVFGRQISRSDCRSLFVRDTDRAFGDGSISSRWAHFFSMANSATRRTIAIDFPFETQLKYSEDIEWSLRVKRAGFKIDYIKDATTYHSHNYSLKQCWQRQYGEGKAEAAIFRNGEIDFGFLRYVILPLGMEVIRDVRYCLANFSIGGLIHTLPLRLVQKLGRWQGLRAGLRS